MWFGKFNFFWEVEVASVVEELNYLEASSEKWDYS
jgi:hypothetical protein